MAVKSKIFNPLWLALVDLFLMFAALRLTLQFKFGDVAPSLVLEHYKIFSFVFVFWLLILFIHNLFDLRSLRRYHILILNFISAAFFCSLSAIVYFYLQPTLTTTPRRSLLLLVLIELLAYCYRGVWQKPDRCYPGLSRNCPASFSVLLLTAPWIVQASLISFDRFGRNYSTLIIIQSQAENDASADFFNCDWLQYF